MERHARHTEPQGVSMTSRDVTDQRASRSGLPEVSR